MPVFGRKHNRSAIPRQQGCEDTRRKAHCSGLDIVLAGPMDYMVSLPGAEALWHRTITSFPTDRPINEERFREAIERTRHCLLVVGSLLEVESGLLEIMMTTSHREHGKVSRTDGFLAIEGFRNRFNDGREFFPRDCQPVFLGVPDNWMPCGVRSTRMVRIGDPLLDPNPVIDKFLGPQYGGT